MGETVSPEALDLLKGVFDCWNDGDFDQMLAMWAEDATLDVSAVFTDIAPATGHADLLRCWGELYESLDGLRMDPVGVVSLGAGRYVIDMRLWGEGRSSGVGVDQRYGYLCAFRREDGKCVGSRLLPDMASALAAAEQA